MDVRRPRPNAPRIGSPAAPWIVFSAVSVGTFMATLDGNIVSVALPSLGADLGAPIARLEWIGFLSYAAMFSQTFLTPFFLARVLGLGPGGLGLALSAVPVALSISSPLAGWISDRFGARALSALGSLFALRAGAGREPAAFLAGYALALRAGALLALGAAAVSLVRGAAPVRT